MLEITLPEETPGVQIPGVEHVQVGVVEGGSGETAETDRDGFVEVAVTVEGDEDVVMEFDHGQWNVYRERLELP